MRAFKIARICQLPRQADGSVKSVFELLNQRACRGPGALAAGIIGERGSQCSSSFPGTDQMGGRETSQGSSVGVVLDCGYPRIVKG